MYKIHIHLIFHYDAYIYIASEFFLKMKIYIFIHFLCIIVSANHENHFYIFRNISAK